MLRKSKSNSRTSAIGLRFAIVASSYNQRYVDGMLDAAAVFLKKAGAKTVKIVRVPGAFEIPTVAAQLARNHKPRPDAILCLGAILRGATTHAQHIAEAVTDALMRIQVETGVPIIHEVLLFENKEQAEVRCLNPEHNRGAEAAHTAIEMAHVMRQL